MLWLELLVTMLNRMEKVASFLILGKALSLSPLCIVFAVVLSWIDFIMWWYFTSITILLSVFYSERVLNFSKCFFASTEMIMWLFFLFVNVAYYIDISLYMLNHPYIPRVNPTVLWCIILLICLWILFANIFWGFSHQCS